MKRLIITAILLVSGCETDTAFQRTKRFDICLEFAKESGLTSTTAISACQEKQSSCVSKDSKEIK